MFSIDGTPSFRKQVNAALDAWQQADPTHMPVMFACMTEIIQHNRDLDIYIDQDGKVYISENIAFWPGVDAELQQKILATYCAHEGFHALLLSKGDARWNDPKGRTGEELALAYQDEIAKRLDIDQKYVKCPLEALEQELESKPYKLVDMRQREEWVPIIGLAVIAVGVNIIAGWRRPRARRVERSFLRRI